MSSRLSPVQLAAAGVAGGVVAALVGVYLLLGLAWVLLIGGVLFAAACLLGVDTGGRR